MHFVVRFLTLRYLAAVFIRPRVSRFDVRNRAMSMVSGSYSGPGSVLGPVGVGRSQLSAGEGDLRASSVSVRVPPAAGRRLMVCPVSAPPGALEVGRCLVLWNWHGNPSDPDPPVAPFLSRHLTSSFSACLFRAV